MEEEYKNYPFYDWVPKPLGIIFMIILIYTSARKVIGNFAITSDMQSACHIVKVILYVAVFA